MVIPTSFGSVDLFVYERLASTADVAAGRSYAVWAASAAAQWVIHLLPITVTIAFNS